MQLVPPTSQKVKNVNKGTGKCIYTPCPHKKVPLTFLSQLLQILTDFHNFSCTTSPGECQSHWRKNFLSHVRYVATIPCENLRHKSNTFHTILALCTCLYRSHLAEPVSMKQTKHSRKSEAQNLCSKCPPFTRTRAFKRLRHCASLPL